MAGVEQTRRWPAAQDHSQGAEPATAVAPMATDAAETFEAAFDPARPPRWPRVLAVVAVVLAAVWVGAMLAALLAGMPAGGYGPLRLIAWIGLGSAPLALLATLAVLLLRTGRVEATAYARAAAGLRAESESLLATLGLLTRRVELARAGLAEQGATLAELGETAGERLATAGATLREEAALVAATAATLDDSAASARTDLGVLLADLPAAEALAGNLSDRLRTLGHDAQAQAEALTARVQALEAAARSADGAAVGATRRLAAELERAEGHAAAIDRRLADATARVEAAGDGAMARSTEALEAVRRGLDAQAAAFAAAQAQAQAALAVEGGEAQRAFGERVEALAAHGQRIAGAVAGQGAAADTALARIETALAQVEERFGAMAALGEARAGTIAGTLDALGGQAEEVARTLDRGQATAETLAVRAGAVRAHVEASGALLGDAIPASLSRLRLHAEHNLQPLAEAGHRVDAIAATAETIVGRLERVGGLLAAHDAAFGALGHSAEERLAEVTSHAEAFGSLLQRTDLDLRGLAEGATVQLVDALLRVRDTAAQAAARAREALAEAIPAAAGQLARASGEAMAQAVAGVGEPHLAAVGAASARAVEAADAATERLTRQLAVLSDTAQALETRAAADDEASFARQMGLLIEALNSAAIDVAKIFSNEPTDTAWAAYLKGDRGVFTRRAVHLLETSDARTIAARYGDDPEFREQVNRYVHDFEAMLRRVLAVREGGPMGVTLLSSDAGKLYVALAQAIERLRR